MFPEAFRKLLEPVDVTVARLIDNTIYEERFNAHQAAFFAAQLAIDSDWLRFQVEPWSPDHIPHQRLYDNPLFGNECEDDQQRFRARGWGRLVGRRMYTQFSLWSGVDCVANPDLLTNVEVSYRSWLWLWWNRQGRSCADRAQADFDKATTEFIGWPDRVAQRQAVYARNLNHFLEVKI